MTSSSRLFGPSDTFGTGRHRTVPPRPYTPGWRARHWVAPLVTIAATLIPVALLTNPTMLAAMSVALLIGGLPHGALDLAMIHRTAHHRSLFVVSLYLGLSLLMFGAWQIAPSLALAVFLTIAMSHFAEDWSAADHPFFALAMSAAVIAVPALFHHQSMARLFTLLTGTEAAAVLADSLLLIAPVAAACATVAIMLFWTGGRRLTAINAGCALCAMTLLPPVIGFAIYFCLIHSPMHFRAGMARLAPATGVARLTVVATLGGLAIATVAFFFLPGAEPSSRIFAASFMTLSILTLPHMAIPLILSRLPTVAPRRRSAGNPRR